MTLNRLFPFLLVMFVVIVVIQRRHLSSYEFSKPLGRQTHDSAHREIELHSRHLDAANSAIVPDTITLNVGSNAITPSFSICADPVSTFFKRSDIINSAEAAWAFFSNLHTELATRLDDPTYFTFAHPHAHFDMLGPIGPRCESMATILGRGWGNDNAKRACGLTAPKAPAHASRFPPAPAAEGEEECVIYSIGGHGEWGFEYGAVQQTAFAVHTFDCTGDYPVPADLRTRVTFHKVCIGPRDEGLFRTWATMLATLGHARPPTHLKMDIEGWEFSVLSAIVDAGVLLPQQISLELHWYTGGVGNSNWGNNPLPDMFRNTHHYNIGKDFVARGYMSPNKDPPTYGYKTPGEVGLFMQRLFIAGGYMLVDRQDNPDCRHCTEVVLARLLCPAAPTPAA